MNKNVLKFVEWLPNNSDMFKGMTNNEVVSKINELSASDEGKSTLEFLAKQYNEMGLFKDGGKLNYLLYLKTGGPVKKCESGEQVPVGRDKAQKRSDKDGSYYLDHDGDRVLTVNGKGTRPLRGSTHQMPGYEAPMSTYVSGVPGNRKIRVYNDWENISWPLAKYMESEPNFIQKIFGWRAATPEYWQSVNEALKANGFMYKKGGKF